jgi:DNA-binding PadR family transcriptional regulator
MTSRSLGEFERNVLLAVHNTVDAAYGTPIVEELEKLTLREISFPAVYTTLRRLEDKGLLASSMGESTPQRGGRAKRYFRLTSAGEKTLNEALLLLRRIALSPGLVRSNA